MKELQFYPLALLGIFSDTEYCGSENSLISYGIFSVNTLRRVGGLSAVALPAAAYPYNPTLLFPPFGRETAPFRPCDGMTV